MQKERSPIDTQKGFSLVEVILSTALFALLVTALVGAFLYGQESTAFAGNHARAVSFAEEGLEVVRNIRDAGFSNLTDGTFGLAVSGNQWTLSTSTDSMDIFTRQITIASLTKDGTRVTAGDTALNSVSITLASQTDSNPIYFSLLGLPDGATADFSPSQCSPNCSSTMTITTSATTPPGAYPMTIVGTAKGAVTQTATFTLTVDPAQH